MGRLCQGIAVGGLLALLPRPAAAQVPAQEVRVSRSGGGGSPRSVQLVGGLQGFTAGLSAGTGVGPFLGVAALWQPMFLLGVELRYEAARLPVDDARLPAGEALWCHAALGVLKLGLPVTERLRPFFGTGLGLGYLQPTDGTGALYGSDVIVELPLVLGLEAQWGWLTGGAQLSYRSVFAESFDKTGSGDASGGRFSVGLSLGARF